MRAGSHWMRRAIASLWKSAAVRVDLEEDMDLRTVSQGHALRFFLALIFTWCLFSPKPL